MISGNQSTSAMEQVLERAIEQNPQSGELLKAFGPIITRQRQLTTAIVLPELDYSAIDRKKLRAGVSVISQISLFAKNEPFKEIALSLAGAVKEGMPGLAAEMNRLADLIAEDRLCLSDYFEVANNKNKATASCGNLMKTCPSNAVFLTSLVARVLLERRAREIAEYLGEYDWEKGYCPICGEFPAIALIEEEGGKRFLHCSSCGQYWRFTRVVCPYCENEAQQGMDYFYVENKTQESAFVCEKCKKYLVTLYRAGNLHARDMDISAISLIHLDILMQGKGYEPMVSCAWNALS